ncbi:hypothetical protein K8T06_07045 [bacterium]|nr:hypothetical protein [bacterium]
MKKIHLFLCVGFPLLTFALVVCQAGFPMEIMAAEPDGIKVIETADGNSDSIQDSKWNWMMYSACDYMDTFAILPYFAAGVYSGENLNIFILEDTTDDTTKLYYIDEN